MTMILRIGTITKLELLIVAKHKIRLQLALILNPLTIIKKNPFAIQH